jgi:Fe-S cluster biogenesis protein NfuA
MSNAIKEQPRFIQIEDTPNPSTLKFVVGFRIMPEGQTASFKSLEECGISKLSKQLLSINDVETVFYGHDFISITKSVESGWHGLKSIIVATILDYLSSGMPILEGDFQPIKDSFDHLSVDEQAIVRQIVELIDTRIKPAVAQDGGDIEFNSYRDGVVYVKMHGACSGCPSSTLTLKDGIENMLQNYIPEVIRVEQI